MVMHGGGPGIFPRFNPRGPEIDKSTKLAPGTVKRALALAAKYKWSIAGFLVVTVITAFLAVVPSLLVRSLVDDAIPSGDRGQVGLIAIGAVGVALLVAAMSMLSRYLTARVGEGLIFDLRVLLFRHVQSMPLAFFTRTKTGSLMSRLQSDVVGAQSAVTGVLQSTVSSVITLVATLAVMISLSLKLTVVALLALPLFVIPSTRTGRKLQVIAREQMSHNAEMSSTMQERFDVSGAMLAKLFGRIDDETRRFSDRAGRVRDLGIKSALVFRSVFAVFGLVAALGTAVIYWLGGNAAIDGTLSVGTVIAFVGLLGNLYGPLTTVTTARTDLMTSFVSFERVFELLDLKEQVADPADGALLGEGNGQVEFKDVSFKYPRASDVSIASLEAAQSFLQGETQTEVLRNVSFLAAPGSTVAIVGPSGAGKTTMSMLIPRLYDVTDGAVLIDGTDVRAVTQESLRAAIGVVSQDPHLFHDSVANNLRFAKPDATDEEVWDAIKGAQLERLVRAMPDELETVVGERGYRLSGGEKQRLAIARVLLKAPRIVILDEATAHLDSESESLVQQALRTALQGRTAIVIAHRLSTILSADQILVLESGAIVQRGKHVELIVQDGLYRELYRTQFAAEPAAS
jgi:ATP-binding cassette, subfamily B, bacterial